MAALPCGYDGALRSDATTRDAMHAVDLDFQHRLALRIRTRAAAGETPGEAIRRAPGHDDAMSDVDQARDLMLAFAADTGIPGSAPPRRYLWTDALATCNFLGLHRLTGERRFLDLALLLVDQVHHVLGRHRDGDARRGWISGLPEEEGARHPTLGGLRIGKKLPEREADEPVDAELEWDRDGQYFHYLTKWMHALMRVGEETGEYRYHDWAVELARSAHAAFTLPAVPGRPRRMAWKMSIDLSRPLVPSMGHHDPLDALITYAGLRATRGGGVLEGEIADVEVICAGMSWATEDPLGIGGLLCDAGRLVGLVSQGADEWLPLLRELVDDAVASVRAFEATGLLRHAPDRRLAFRELGLAIGLHAVERARPRVTDEVASARMAQLAAWLPLARSIESAWADPRAQQVATWTDHQDINAVMLATSLAPDGFLGGQRVDAASG